eukprot:c20718_g1_i1 orf=295-522(-)
MISSILAMNLTLVSIDLSFGNVYRLVISSISRTFLPAWTGFVIESAVSSVLGGMCLLLESKYVKCSPYVCNYLPT